MGNENEIYNTIYSGDVSNLGALSRAIIRSHKYIVGNYRLFKLKMNNKEYLVIHEMFVGGMLKDAQGNYTHFKRTLMSYIKKSNTGKVELTILSDLRLKEEMVSIMSAYALIG